MLGPSVQLDALILADAPTASYRIAGLSLVERGRRVASRVGAQRVLVVDGDRAAIASWWRGGRADRLLVIRAGDQLVHPPLVTPLVAAPDAGVAIDPDAGEYAGAFLIGGPTADRIVDALAAGADDRTLAAELRASGVGAVPYAEGVARHPVRDAVERRAAERLLYTILVKPQDNVITRYMYRPVSLPLTKLLARTPITPNQISYAVAVLCAVGLWLTAHAAMSWAIAGTALLLVASYVDCCDGEIARLKLQTSRFGAWLDTVIDELSSVGYMLAIGWHCHLYFGPNYFGNLGFDPWLVVMWVSLATYLASIYFIYYNIIVVVGSANSQDYAGRLEAVPGDAPGTMKLRPAPGPTVEPRTDLPAPIRAILAFAPNIVRRDFISWCALAYAVLHVTHVAFATLALGGAIAVVILAVDHVRLRRQRRALARRGWRLSSAA